MNKIVILVLFIVSFHSYKLYGQEIGISGFYQVDRLYDARPGISICYTKHFNDIFSAELEYGNQYIKQKYTTSNELSSNKIDAEIFMNNISISFLLSVVNMDKFQLQIGNKPTFVYIFGNENVHQTYYEYAENNTINIQEKDFTRNPNKSYYSSSKEIRIKFKEVIIPNLSINVKLSGGYILNGARVSGCLVMPYDIWAPYGRVGIGISYNFTK